MRGILNTGKTVILLNGVPGSWFSCARGLWHGDPLSPYLFIIVVDLLCRLIEEGCRAGRIKHPAAKNVPCPVLQYAADTLIMVRADLDVVCALKDIIDAFAAATGLVIN